MNDTQTAIKAPHLEPHPLIHAEVNVYIIRDGEDGTRYWHVVVKRSTRTRPEQVTFSRDYLSDDSPFGVTADQAATDLLGIVMTS